MEREMVGHLKDDDFEQKIEKGVSLVEFQADWCGPCRMLAPVLEQVEKEVAGNASIWKVNIDNEQKTASQFQITSVPTMILFKDGKEVSRLIGLRNADVIKKFVLSV